VQSEIASHESEKKGISFTIISFNFMNLEELLSLCNFFIFVLALDFMFFYYGFGSLHLFAATFVFFFMIHSLTKNTMPAVFGVSHCLSLILFIYF
jgi:hypothetical protein